MADIASKTETRIPMSRIQRLIGERMLESKQTKPCYYMGIDADTTELMDSRHELKKQLGVKITSNAFYIKALGLAVKEFPLMVGKPEGESIKIADSVNVGFAVNAPHGLVVPVVKEAEKNTLAQIAQRAEQIGWRDPAHHGRSNQYAGNNLAGYAGLTEALKEFGKQLGCAEDDQQGERQGHRTGGIDWMHGAECECAHPSASGHTQN